ncbi:Heme-binding protein A [Burkholderiales bacterium]|nr:Heme-binding protein A [Burkholderiales bacterium]
MPHRLVAACLASIALACASATLAAEPPRVLRTVLNIAETSFDPQFASDAASDAVIAEVFESMLDFDYLVRPLTVVPLTLEALPVSTDGGRTWLCRLRKGIRFASDPAFGGKPRELVAADYAYTFRRILDPAVKSPWLWLLEGKLAGGEEARAKAVKTGRFDYDAPLPGLEVVDRYTLRIRLNAPDLRFPYVLAIPNTGAVAREVVEAYGADLGAKPVGTGAFRLVEYKRSSRMVLERNPDHRARSYVPAGPVPPESQAIAAALRGKRLPLLDRVEISVIEEAQSRWLAFLNHEIDVDARVSSTFVDELLADGRLMPRLAAKGIRHEAALRPNTYWFYFNMDDPVVGGYEPAKIALRRAIAMAYDAAEALRVLQKGRGILAQSLVPPGIAGHDPARRFGAQAYDPPAARALLERFGYKDRDGDGWRETPDGKPLVLERWSVPTASQRDADELWKKNMDAIGLKLAIRKDKLPELRKMARAGKIPFRSDGWNADYPDAENFMQLLYGPNAGQENQARFRLPEYDRLHDEARRLPDGPRRTALFGRMHELIVAYAPIRLTQHIVEDHAWHARVTNYRAHPIRQFRFGHYGVDGPVPGR